MTNSPKSQGVMSLKYGSGVSDLMKEFFFKTKKVKHGNAVSLDSPLLPVFKNKLDENFLEVCS